MVPYVGRHMLLPETTDYLSFLKLQDNFIRVKEKPQGRKAVNLSKFSKEENRAEKGGAILLS